MTTAWTSRTAYSNTYCPSGRWLEGQGHTVRYLVGQTSRKDIPGVHSMSRNVRVSFNGNRVTIPLPTSQIKYTPRPAGRTPGRTARTGAVQPVHGTQDDNERRCPHGRHRYLPYRSEQPLVDVGNRALGIWLRRSLKRFDAMLSVSQAAADFASDTFRVKSEISPNVIDYGRFNGAKPLEAYDDGRLTILFLGRLVPRKGCLQLLKAVSLLSKRNDLPKFRVVICGTGPLETSLAPIYTSRTGLKKW